MDLPHHSDELELQNVSILSTQRAEPAFDELGRDVSLMTALMALVWTSIISNSSERRRSSAAFIRAATPRSQLIGGCLVQFNKANELPASITLQRLHSLPGFFIYLDSLPQSRDETNVPAMRPSGMACGCTCKTAT